MIILKAREPVLIVNSILKAPISKRVWAALVDIPWKTRTYFEQAKTLGDVKAIRAVALPMVKSPMDSSALP
jgi:O6-methylguanine-DNA--protein-cysteine methyltransferase